VIEDAFEILFTALMEEDEDEILIEILPIIIR
jgi:hypothetical protein